MNIPRGVSTIACVVAFIVACGAGDDNGSSRSGDASRGPLGKADAFGSCVGHCGEKSDGNCWCDEACLTYGDCCFDRAAACALGAACPSPDDAFGGIISERSLFIVHPGVVDDPRAAGLGPWSYATVVSNMAPPGVKPGAWLGPSFNHAACRMTESHGVACDADGNVDDLATVPVRLAAIVNRTDLVTPETPSGELRLIYQITEVRNDPARPGAMFENFELDLASVRGEDGQAIPHHEWAAELAALSLLEPGSDGYNDALGAIIERVTRRGAAPDRPSGSALRSLRRSRHAWNWGNPQMHTWRLGSARIAPDGALLDEGLERTPNGAWGGFDYGGGKHEEYRQGSTQHLLSLMIDHEQQIFAGQFDFPPPIPSNQKTADSPLTQHTRTTAGWNYGTYNFLGWHHEKPIDDLGLPTGWGHSRLERLRAAFGLQTCNGCHGAQTNTSGNHVIPREGDAPAELSPFLQHHELPRRLAFAAELVCAKTPPTCDAPVSCGSSPHALVHPLINEVRIGGRVGEFIELIGPPGMSLDGHTLQRAHAKYDLTGLTIGENGHFVFAFDGLVDVAAEASIRVHVTSDTNQWKVVALLAGESRVDAVQIGAATVGTPFTGEGTPTAASEDVTSTWSRIPNATDTQDNAADFSLGPATPGRDNCR